MSSPRSTLTRSLALLLPICFLWVFAACVSSCAAEAGETDHGTAVHTDGVMSLDAAHDESCSFAIAPDGLPPESSSLVPPVAERPRGFFTSPASPNGNTYLPLQAVTPAAPDPPFSRLCTLRI